MLRTFILLSLVFLSACEGTVAFDDPELVLGSGFEAADDRGITVSALTGVELYTQQCASCHGAQGEGTPIWPAPIKGFAPITTIVRDGRGTMPAIPLPDDQVAKIQEYISSLAAPVEELDGSGLYQRYCASCHGADASGAATWPDSIQGYEPIATIVLQGRGEMASVPVTPEQTQQIQDWLLTLGTPTEELDGQGLYTRYCASCHGADASGDVEWASSIQGYEPIATIVQQGRGNMDPIAVSPEQIQQIQDWLLTLAPALSTLSGEQVYERLCVSCHGEQGEGIDTVGMQLRYDDDTFSRYWIRNGRAATGGFADDMPAYASDVISDTQIDEMMTFINQAQHPTTGEGLYLQYCANCHGVTGGGGPSGHGIRGDSGITGVSRNGKGGSSYGARRDYMTSWSTSQLSDTELQMIGAYVGGL